MSATIWPVVSDDIPGSEQTEIGHISGHATRDQAPRRWDSTDCCLALGLVHAFGHKQTAMADSFPAHRQDLEHCRDPNC